jgi:formylglycine-generating enzyme required for sulfatase activity
MGQADSANVSGFRLDKYLVTVGRFRQFVAAWNNGSGYTPSALSGKHTHLNGGLGLVNVGGDAGVAYEPGWLASDDSNIAPTNASLACGGAFWTWTPTAGSQENLPISCASWWEAEAFCIWDGGFLPSESEWEYAAAGGSQQREYPWGTAAPGTSNQYAIYGNGGPGSANDCYYPTGTLSPCTGVANIAPVGTAALGAGLWGHLDLEGDEDEWILDFSADYVSPCIDCAYLTPTAPGRVVRASSFSPDSGPMSPANRSNFVIPPTPNTYRASYLGFRCARTP